MPMPGFRVRGPLLAAIAVAGIAGGMTVLPGFSPSGSQDLPDFTQWPAGPERKTRFFRYLRPLVEAENARILADRERLSRLAGQAARDRLSWLDRRRLRTLADDYDVPYVGVHPTTVVAQLLLRADAVPVSLALAQAAKESGWGTSRFAREGFALFGERCFEAGCGMVPRARRAGLKHEVTRFDSVREAVSGYIMNLNTHRDYEAFRQMRAQLRNQASPHPGIDLAGTLVSYSERREAYIREIRQMIRFNGLSKGIIDG